MSASIIRRGVASALVIGLSQVTSSGVLFAAPVPTLSGRVVAENGVDSRPGVVVALVDASADKIYRSNPTDERGGFRVEAPSPGSYALVVEAPEGAFLASDGLALAPGLNRPVSLALKPGRAAAAPTPGSSASAKKSSVPTWAKWVIAGGIVVGGLIVIDAVTKDDKEASLSN